MAEDTSLQSVQQILQGIKSSIDELNQTVKSNSAGQSLFSGGGSQSPTMQESISTERGYLTAPYSNAQQLSVGMASAADDPRQLARNESVEISEAKELVQQRPVDVGEMHELVQQRNVDIGEARELERPQSIETSEVYRPDYSQVNLAETREFAAGVSLSSGPSAPIYPAARSGMQLAGSSFSDILQSPVGAMEAGAYSVQSAAGIGMAGAGLVARDISSYTSVGSHLGEISQSLQLMDSAYSTGRFDSFTSRLDSTKAMIGLGAVTALNKTGKLAAESLIVGAATPFGLGLPAMFLAPALTAPTFGAFQNGAERSFQGYMDARQVIKAIGEPGTKLPPGEVAKLQMETNMGSISKFAPSAIEQSVKYHFMGYRGDEVQKAMAQMSTEGRFEQPNQGYSGAAEKISKRLMGTLKDVDKAARLLDVSKKEAWGIVRRNEQSGVGNETFTDAVLKTSMMTGQTQSAVTASIKRNEDVIRSLGIGPGMLGTTLAQSSAQAAIGTAPLLSQQQLLQVGGRAGLQEGFSQYTLQGLARDKQQIQLALGSGGDMTKVMSWDQLQNQAIKGMENGPGGYYEAMAIGAEKFGKMDAAEAQDMLARKDLSILKTNNPEFDQLSDKRKKLQLQGYMQEQRGMSPEMAKAIAARVVSGEGDISKMTPAQRIKYDASLKANKDVEAAMTEGARMRSGLELGLKGGIKEGLLAAATGGTSFIMKAAGGVAGAAGASMADWGETAEESARILALQKGGNLDLAGEVREKYNDKLDSFNSKSSTFAAAQQGRDVKKIYLTGLGTEKDQDKYKRSKEFKSALASINKSLSNDLERAALDSPEEFMKVLEESGKEELKSNKVRAQLAKDYKVKMSEKAGSEEVSKAVGAKLLGLLGLGEASKSLLNEADQLKDERLGLTRAGVMRKKEKEEKKASARQADLDKSVFEPADTINQRAKDLGASVLTFGPAGVAIAALKQSGVFAAAANYSDNNFGTNLNGITKAKSNSIIDTGLAKISGFFGPGKVSNKPLFELNKKDAIASSKEDLASIDKGGVSAEEQMVRLLRLSTETLQYIAYSK